jgi:hypothetical protein
MVSPEPEVTRAQAPDAKASHEKGVHTSPAGSSQDERRDSTSPFASKKSARPRAPDADQWARVSPESAKAKRRDSKVAGSSGSPGRSKTRLTSKSATSR